MTPNTHLLEVVNSETVELMGKATTGVSLAEEGAIWGAFSGSCVG